MQLTKNFSLSEMTASKTGKAHGVGNTPTDEEIICLKLLCEKILQPCRDALDMAIKVQSAYRCRQLNAMVGGSKLSQHIKGQAADLVCKNNLELFNYIKDNLEFDQLINEKPISGYPSWVHVSYRGGGVNRKEVLIYNGTYYEKYS